MSTITLPRRSGLLAPSNPPELFTVQWRVGVALDKSPAYQTETRALVKRFLKQTGFSGMQLVFLRVQLRFAMYGRAGMPGRSINELQRFADQQLLEDLNSPGAALRLVRLPRDEWILT